MKKLKITVQLIDTTNDKKDFDNLCSEKGGFHAFAFICPLTRYEESNMQFLDDIISKFGEPFFSRCILIFTQRSKEQDESELTNDIKNVKKIDPNMRKLLNDETKYLVCPDFKSDNLTSEKNKSFQHLFANSLSEIAFRCFENSKLKIKQDTTSAIKTVSNKKYNGLVCNIC